MKRFIALVFLFLSLNLLGGEIIVAAAANTQYAMEEIKKAFEKKKGIKIKFVISSSGKLTAQIKNGAPFDIFLSANMKYPLYLYKSGFSLNKPDIYAYGSLVLWTLKPKKVDVEKGIKVLTSRNVKKAAIANPKNAPYGFEALKALKNAKIYKEVKNKLIYGESISQTNQYIVSKAVDVGITAKSVVLSPKMMNRGKYVPIETSLYDPIKQGVVILKNANKHFKEVKMFYDFLFEREAKEIFEKFGYEVL